MTVKTVESSIILYYEYLYGISLVTKAIVSFYKLTWKLYIFFNVFVRNMLEKFCNKLEGWGRFILHRQDGSSTMRSTEDADEQMSCKSICQFNLDLHTHK